MRRRVRVQHPVRRLHTHRPRAVRVRHRRYARRRAGAVPLRLSHDGRVRSLRPFGGRGAEDFEQLRQRAVLQARARRAQARLRAADRGARLLCGFASAGRRDDAHRQRRGHGVRRAAPGGGAAVHGRDDHSRHARRDVRHQLSHRARGGRTHAALAVRGGVHHQAHVQEFCGAGEGAGQAHRARQRDARGAEDGAPVRP